MSGAQSNALERKAVVLRPSEIPARQRGGGAKTIPLVTRRTGATSFINGITIFEPNAAIPLHFHNCDESVLMLEGSAIAEIDGVEVPVNAGDTSFIPAGIPHRFRNVSTTEGMRILWTYASINATRTIVATGETRSIDDEHQAPIAP
jgi:quercetin dioxygenase-like cupin family protein